MRATTLQRVAMLGLLTALIAVVLPFDLASTASPQQLQTLAELSWTAEGDGSIAAPVPAGNTVAVSVTLPAATVVDIRTRTGSTWSPWRELAAAADHAPDPDTSEAATATSATTSELEWLGRVDALQVRTDGDPSQVVVTGTQIDRDAGMAYRPGIDDQRAGVADAASWPPAMVARSSWDPNGECAPRRNPDVAPRVERVFVHHTAIFPEYAPEEGDDIVRAICINHVQRRGFDDLGYNFMIDRYGVIYQGRAGGVFRPVVGAHAAGFNAGAAGIALIGNHQTGDVTEAATVALDTLIAWLADLHGLDPFGTSVAISTGGATTRFPEGTPVELPTIVGHRDTGDGTACPGDFLYERVRGVLPIAPRVAARMQHPPAPLSTPVIEPPVEVASASAVVDGSLEWFVRGLVTTGRLLDATRAAFGLPGSGGGAGLG